MVVIVTNLEAKLKERIEVLMRLSKAQFLQENGYSILAIFVAAAIQITYILGLEKKI